MRLLLSVVAFVSLASADDFSQSIRPVLNEHCSPCHNPQKSRVDFLKAQTAGDMEARRGLWRNVAAQLRNRTMPPVASKLTEEDRLRIATWIDERLRATACNGQPYQPPVVSRRLNRREYRNSIRDMLGVDLAVNELFPEDGSGGEGFDTNGGTLFLPPMLLERYMEAAQQILDRVIITPPLNKMFNAWELKPAAAGEHAMKRAVAPGEELSGTVAIYVPGDYEIRLALDRPTKGEAKIGLKIDGREAGVFNFARYETPGGAARSLTARLSRGAHVVSIQPIDAIQMFALSVDQKQQEPSGEKRALHYRLFAMEPGETPFAARRGAERLLTNLVRQAYRRPVTAEDVTPYLTLYDRAAERGDPYEERIKLALKALLVSPKFLFHTEEGDYAMASRLSYFLWSTAPDAELTRLAAEGRLRDPNVLAAQVDRMLDDPRTRVFANTFTGQWLGTKDVGGRLVPAIADVQQFYTPEVAADLREEPVMLFHYILGENRSLLDLLDGDYTFLTERLVHFYQVEDKVKLQGSGFQLVHWPDRRRGGLVGLGSVLAMTAHYKATSPVLRGAWVLETLLGTAVPPPPPNIPPLDTPANKNVKMTMRQKLTQHRSNPSCTPCHNVIDPIGFGLENFDWMGRWRDTDNGVPVDASAVTPEGEKFNGPVELRQVLLQHKDQFLRTITSNMLGYALGRGLQDGDQCAVQQIMDRVAKDDYHARTLVREIVLSAPFRGVRQ